MSGLVFLTVWWGQEANDLLHGPAFHVDRVVGASNVGHRAVGLIEMKDKDERYTWMAYKGVCIIHQS